MVFRTIVCWALLAFASPARAAEISGVVRDGSTQAPLAGVGIAVVHLTAPPGLLGPVEPVGEAVTGADGRYAITTSRTGYHQITAQHPQYRSITATRTVDASDVAADLTMFRPATIVVHVTDAAGAPLQGVFASVTRSGGGGAGSNTDASGTSTLAGLEHGSYYACVRNDSDQYINECHDGVQQPLDGRLVSGNAVSVQPGETKSVTLALDEGAALEGTILDRYSGMPIRGRPASFSLFDASGQTHYFSATAVTDDEGRYRIGGLRESAYRLELWGITGPPPFYSRQRFPLDDCSRTCEAAEGAAFVIAARSTNRGFDFHLFPRTVIRGRVTDAGSGAPIPGASIVGTESFPLPASVVATTDTQGRYELQSLSPGRARVVAHAGGYFRVAWPDQACTNYSCGNASSFELSEYQVHEADFAMVRGPSIAGRVRALESGILIDADVVVSDADAALAPTRTRNGSYRTPALSPGSYYISANATGICRQHGGAACSDPGAVPIVIGTEDVAGVDVLLPVGRFADSFEGD